MALKLLVAIVFLVTTSASSAAARDVLGSSQYSPRNFRQCGGKGGSCVGNKNPKCKDERWPSDQGGKCATGLYCYRVSEWHWGCDIRQPRTESPTYSSKVFRQCGGRGGACTGSRNAKCKDARWPLDQGGKCDTGLKCYRVSEYHWGCDTIQPRTL